MFMAAEEFLDKCGFDVTVTKDVSALKKLATGDLQVWAAAWSSTVDPDMYQVYHKDSKATSVKNWGYPTILNDSTDQFLEEQGLIDELSTYIEEARKTNDQQTRAEIYEQALETVMELAVEMPTYQRKDCVAYNKDVIDAASLNQNPTAFAGVIDRIWELDYN
jgi:peptide/nickel transport system substrate-binding protein